MDWFSDGKKPNVKKGFDRQRKLAEQHVKNEREQEQKDNTKRRKSHN